jgi:hypothetical protein
MAAPPTIEAYCPACDKVHQLQPRAPLDGYYCGVRGGFTLLSYGYCGIHAGFSVSKCSCEADNIFDWPDIASFQSQFPARIYLYEGYMPKFVRYMWYEALDGCHSQELESTFPKKFGEILSEVKAVRSEALIPHLPPVLSDIVLDYFGAVAIVPH